MKINFSFSTLRDLSDLSSGRGFINILSKYGLIIDKAGEYEPVKEDFITANFNRMWTSQLNCMHFLFKGMQKIKFSGMVAWNLNAHPNSKLFNGVSLWLNIPERYDVCELVWLGDELFIWSGAEYGFITEDSKDLSKIFIQKKDSRVSIGNIYSGISGLMWVNYIGNSYLSETDFHLPDGHVSVGHGAKIILTERPDDECLNNLNFLKAYTNKIGAEWFYHFESIINGTGFLSEPFVKCRTPFFDTSALVRRDVD